MRTRLGVCREQAERLNRHYLKAIRARVPYVALHAGISLDGKLTDKAGRSRWVTSEEGRRYSHSLRGEFSAILAGRGNIVADNPLLTLREPGWEGKTLYRVVLDSQQLALPAPEHIQGAGAFPVDHFQFHATPPTRRKKCRAISSCATTPTACSWPTCCSELCKLGISSLLVEGGGRVFDSFVRERLFDEMAIFYSNKIIGGRNSGQIFASGVPIDEGAGAGRLPLDHFCRRRHPQGVQKMFTGLISATASLVALEKKTSPVLTVRVTLAKPRPSATRWPSTASA